MDRVEFISDNKLESDYHERDNSSLIYECKGRETIGLIFERPLVEIQSGLVEQLK